MALLSTPKVLFMDEPSNYMDPVSRKNLYTYLRSLSNTAILLITHKPDEAEKVCDKVAFMHAGRFFEMDSPNRLK